MTMKDHSGFDLNNIDPMEIGRQLSQVYDEFGTEAAVQFVDRLAASFGIEVVSNDKDHGYSSEYIHTRLKAFIMYCGLLYEVKRTDND